MKSTAKSSKTGLKSREVSKDHFSSNLHKKDTLPFTHLVVRLLQGFRLLASDVETGKSDPICFLKVTTIDDVSPLLNSYDAKVSAGYQGEEHMSTSIKSNSNRKSMDKLQHDMINNTVFMSKVCKTTVDPIWNEDVLLPVPIHDINDLLSMKLVIIVRDEDINFDGSITYDDLGMIEVPFRQLLSESRVLTNAMVLSAHKYNLKKTPVMRRVDGSIKLTLSLIFSEEDCLPQIERFELGLSSMENMIKKLKAVSRTSGISIAQAPMTMDETVDYKMANTIDIDHDNSEEEEELVVIQDADVNRSSLPIDESVDNISPEKFQSILDELSTMKQKLSQLQSKNLFHDDADHHDQEDAIGSVDLSHPISIEDEDEDMSMFDAPGPGDESMFVGAFNAVKNVFGGGSTQPNTSKKVKVKMPMIAPTADHPSSETNIPEKSVPAIPSTDTVIATVHVSAVENTSIKNIPAQDSPATSNILVSPKPMTEDIKSSSATIQESVRSMITKTIDPSVVKVENELDLKTKPMTTTSNNLVIVPDQVQPILPSASKSEKVMKPISVVEEPEHISPVSTSSPIATTIPSHPQTIANIPSTNPEHAPKQPSATSTASHHISSEQALLHPSSTPKLANHILSSSVDQLATPVPSATTTTVSSNKVGSPKLLSADQSTPAIPSPSISASKHGQPELPQSLMSSASDSVTSSAGGNAASAARALREVAQQRDILQQHLEDLMHMTSEGLKSLNQRVESMEKKSTIIQSSSLAKQSMDTSSIISNTDTLATAVSSRPKTANQVKMNDNNRMKSLRQFKKDAIATKLSQTTSMIPEPDGMKDVQVEMFMKGADGEIKINAMRSLYEDEPEYHRMNRSDDDASSNRMISKDKMISKSMDRLHTSNHRVNWSKVEKWYDTGDHISCFAEALDRGDLSDLSKLMEMVGPKPESLSISLRNRTFDSIAMMLAQNMNIERCLIWTLAIVRGSDNLLSTMARHTLREVIDSLRIIGREPSRRGLLASLLASQLDKQSIPAY